MRKNALTDLEQNYDQYIQRIYTSDSIEPEEKFASVDYNRELRSEENFAQ